MVLSLVRSAVHQREDPCLFPGVIEGTETSDFIEATLAVECVEIMRVAGGELACLEITAPGD